MQQAARNVAVENSRLRILLGYHGITAEDIDKFLQSFPDQLATDAAKPTPLQSAAGQPPALGATPKMALRSLSRPPSADPIRSIYMAPQIAEKSSTREVVDAIVGIKRDGNKSGSSSSSGPPLPPIERQPLLQPRPRPPALPVLPALILGQSRPEPNPLDKLSVLANASAQQEPGASKHHRTHSRTDSLLVPSPPVVGQSSPTSSHTTPSRLSSTSPRSCEYGSRSPLDIPIGTVPSFVTEAAGRRESDLANPALSGDKGVHRSPILRVHDERTP